MQRLWGLVLEWAWSWSILSKCDWNHCQISTAKIWQHFALFSWRESSSTLPTVHHSTRNTVLTKLLMWEYGNGDASFSWRKILQVLHLVHYGASEGFCICVCSVYQHARTETSRSPSKHQVYWCMSHTRGNQRHLVTWIKTITLR